MADELFKLKKSIYYYKEHKYEVLGTCRLKCPTTGNWLAAVIYQNYSTSEHLNLGEFVRELSDFLNKFKVEEDEEINF